MINKINDKGINHDRYEFTNNKRHNLNFPNSFNKDLNFKSSKKSKQLQNAKKYFQRFETLNNFNVSKRKKYDNLNAKVDQERKSNSFQPFRTDAYFSENLKYNNRRKK